jgi:hypothetical protein
MAIEMKTGRVSSSSRPTIFSVAKEAGVSITAVSLILNHKKSHKYSPEVEAKVLAACQNLNYKPNSLARSLAKQTNSAIGILCQSLDDHNITRAVMGFMSLYAPSLRKSTGRRCWRKAGWVGLSRSWNIWFISRGN